MNTILALIYTLLAATALTITMITHAGILNRVRKGGTPQPMRALAFLVSLAAGMWMLLIAAQLL